MGKFNYSKRIKHNFLRIDNVTVFCDIVGFTKLNDNDTMRRYVQELHSSISNVFSEYEWDLPKNNDLILIPSGDGYGIAFRDDFDPEKTLDLTVKLYTSLREVIKLRIGISKGPNLVFMDLNDKLNIIGWGINRAQRVMTVALENQILCDASFAEFIQKHKSSNKLIKLGKAKVKHGEQIEIYNFFSNQGVGNPQAPDLFSKDL